MILIKASFDSKVSLFFWDYLVDRKTRYFWNNFSSPFFNINVGVGQESALSPILWALYLSPLLYIFEKWLKILKISVFILSFIDDGLFVAQDKSLIVSNLNLFYSYHIIFSLLEKFGLIVKYGKIEVFHFSRSHSTLNPPLLDLSLLGGPVLKPKNTWYYLRFIFNRKLMFRQYIDFYSNKIISMIKCMKMLSNSLRGLIPTQKRCLYRSCILPIILYSFQM